MSVIINQDWRPKTYRELFTQWQSFQLDRWEHTAAIKASWATKKTNVRKFHPYRDSSGVSGGTGFEKIKVDPKKTTFTRRINRQRVKELLKEWEET